MSEIKRIEHTKQIEEYKTITAERKQIIKRGTPDKNPNHIEI